MAPVRGAEPRARRAAHVVPPGGQGRQSCRRPRQEQEAAARAAGLALAATEEALGGGERLEYIREITRRLFCVDFRGF